VHVSHNEITTQADDSLDGTLEVKLPAEERGTDILESSAMLRANQVRFFQGLEKHCLANVASAQHQNSLATHSDCYRQRMGTVEIHISVVNLR